MEPDVINRPLSDQWRSNKSSIPLIELANILKAVRRVVGSISSNNETVIFGGMNDLSYNTQGKEIVITRQHVMQGEWPVPGKQIDITMGLACHESLHSKSDAAYPQDFARAYENGVISADMSVDTVRGKQHRIPDTVADFGYGQFISTAEEVYCEGLGLRHYPIHNKYIQLAREAYRTSRDIPPDNINAVWLICAVYGRDWDTTIKDSPTILDPVWSVLRTLTNSLKSSDYSKLERLALYVKVWDALHGLLSTLDLKEQLSGGQQGDLPENLKGEFSDTPGDKQNSVEMGTNSDGNMAPVSNQPDTEPGEIMDDKAFHKGDENGKSVEDLEAELKHITNELTQTLDSLENPYGSEDDTEILEARKEEFSQKEQELKQDKEELELVQQLEAVIESGMEDMTSQVGDILEEAVKDDLLNNETLGRFSGMYNRRNLPIIWDTPKGEPFESEPDPKIVKELGWLKRIKNEASRSTLRGREDGRLDSRRLYRYKASKNIFKQTLVRPQEKLDLVILTDESGSMDGKPHNIVFEAINSVLKEVPETQVITYRAERNSCDLNMINPEGILQEHRPGGGTPTSRALLATAIKYPKSLIVHFTDGQANSDIPLQDVFTVLDSKFPKIKVISLILESDTTRNHPRYKDVLPREWINVVERFPEVIVRKFRTIEDFPKHLKDAVEAWYKQ